jgi:uncharacterized protein (TIGR03083 family)
MTDDHELEGLDPCAILDAEALRIDAFLSTFPDDDPAWDAPTGCAAWNRRQLLNHLAHAEEYHHACFQDRLGPFFETLVAAGATDLHGFNELGLKAREGRPPSEVLAEWREADAWTRRAFRERGAAEMATSVGLYPARWQAFHVASELATHADDLGVPVSVTEAASRLRWRARFSRFALMEAKPGVVAESAGGDVTAIDGPLQLAVDDATFVAAVAGRLGPEAPLDAEERSLLSTMP